MIASVPAAPTRSSRASRAPRSLRRAALSALLALAGACGVDEDKEVSYGRQTVEQIDAQLPLVSDPAINDYITAMGMDMARRTARAELPWRFRIVNSAEVNAFAVPGGFIYVNRGLIERADTQSELAGVLGHEIGHVTLRHSAEQMEKASKGNVAVTLLCTLTSVCEGGLTRVAINAAGQAWFAKHSRADELEADSAAVVHVIEAGITPQGIPRFFEKLMAERRARPGALSGWFASHPLEEDRIRAAERLIGSIEPGSLRGLADDAPHFHAFRDRLRALPAAPAPKQLPR